MYIYIYIYIYMLGPTKIEFYQKTTKIISLDPGKFYIPER
jgi:hypothetical protein